MPETTVEIFSDGACSGNPGPGGYGAILRWNGKEKELSGGEKHTTNNRMELTGVIEALTALKYPCKGILTTDSKYVVDSVTKGWVNGWKRRGWKKSDNTPALNVDNGVPLAQSRAVIWRTAYARCGIPLDKRPRRTPRK